MILHCEPCGFFARASEPIQPVPVTSVLDGHLLHLKRLALRAALACRTYHRETRGGASNQLKKPTKRMGA